MQIVKQLPAYILALPFAIFGVAYFFGYHPTPGLTGDPMTYLTLMSKGYMDFVKVCEAVFGIMIFIPKTRALGLLLIAPVSVNILAFELFIAHQPGIGVALVILNALAIYLNKEKYMGIL